uniref:Uncharacterized protein n=1 Tax=Anguilla anguilla TaxID=7936 RepID=A0A0E9UN42_ANGAN
MRKDLLIMTKDKGHSNSVLIHILSRRINNI